MIRFFPRPVVGVLLAGALLLAACGEGGESTTTDGVPVVTATTLPEAAFSAVALEAAAVAFGRAMLDEDAHAVHTMMTRRCRELVSRAHLAAVINLILRAMEAQQDITVDQVRVLGAFTGEIVDGRAKASMRLNYEIFSDPEFAFLPMQPWVFEGGEWRYDACDQMAGGGGQPGSTTTTLADTTTTLVIATTVES